MLVMTLNHHFLSSYDLEFTVPQDLVAVSNGTLLYQVKISLQ